MRVLLWERAGFLLRPGTLLSSQQWKWPVLIRGAGEAKLRSLRVPVQSWAGQAQQDKERRCSVINPEHGSVTHIQSSTAQFHPLETSQLWVPQALVETSHCCVSLSSPEQSCPELQPPWQGALWKLPCFPWHQHAAHSKAPPLGLARSWHSMACAHSAQHSRTAAPWSLQSAPLPHRGGWWLPGALCTLLLAWGASNSVG